MKLPGLVYTSPTVFTRKQRLILRFAPPLVALCLRALVRTCRMEVRGMAQWNTVQRDYGRAILAFWHESMGLAACYCRNTGYHTLTSYSFDGEFAARVVRWFGLRAVRGSSSRGGSHALIQLEKALEHVTVGFTLDGPRGPRREAKPGIAILSARTGVPILPFALVANRSWRLHSWDRFPVPKPFSRIVCAFGAPLPPPADSSREAVEKRRDLVERELRQLHTAIEVELNVDSQ